jgi:hypothetical protein
MRNVRFTYRGKPWIAYIAPEAEVGQMAEDPHCPAFVETTAREIYFSNNYELNIINVLHELWHMAVSECHISSVNMAQHEMEEFTAELFANEGEAVIDLGKKLLKAMNKLKNMKTDSEIHLDDESKNSQ